MSEDELLQLVDQNVFQSTGYIGGELSEQRREAMDAYLGMPYGDEKEGRSQVVLTDVQDTIEWMLPSLIEIFVSNDRAVQFTPTNAEDVEAAEQETDYINHVFYKDNEGFKILYTWFKDALLSKNGIVKAVPEEEVTVNDDVYEGLTQIQFVQLAENAELEMLAVDEYIDNATGQPMFDCRVRRTRRKKKIKIYPVPPEQFLIERRALSIENATFTCHRLPKTQSELILEGYDEDVVKDLPSYDGEEYGEERYTRFSFDDEYPFGDEGGATHESTREIWINECYIRVDFDGDGIAELRKVVTAGGENGVLLSNDVWEHTHAPFYDICPTPITHKFFGLSVADLTMDIQRIRTVLLRQMLDAQYLANNPRHSIIEGRVNIDDMLTDRPGSLVRITAADAHPQPIVSQPPQQTTYNLFEFMTGERESRTGVSRYTQGLDPGSLNDTASGINQLMTAAQMRMKLVARLFAEDGLRKLFLGIHELTRKHQDVSRTLRMRNKWVDVDPTAWQERVDMTIEVGLGAGNKEAQLMHLDSIAQAQAIIVQGQGGMNGPLIQAKHIYNLMEKKAELAGFKQPDLFVGDPDDPDNQPKPQGPPPPDPAIEKIKADLQIKQAEIAADREAAQLKAQQDAAEAAEKIQFEYQKLAQERQEHEDKMALEYAKIEADAAANDLDVISKHIDRQQAEMSKTERDIELERMRGENTRFAASEKDRDAARPVRSTTKAIQVQRGRDGKITGATVVEGPNTK